MKMVRKKRGWVWRGTLVTANLSIVALAILWMVSYGNSVAVSAPIWRAETEFFGSAFLGRMSIAVSNGTPPSMQEGWSISCLSLEDIRDTVRFAQEMGFKNDMPEGLPRFQIGSWTRAHPTGTETLWSATLPIWVLVLIISVLPMTSIALHIKRHYITRRAPST